MRDCSLHRGIIEETDLPDNIDVERYESVLRQNHQNTGRTKYSDPDYCGLEVEELDGAIYFEFDKMTNNVKDYITDITEDLVEDVGEVVIFSERLDSKQRYTLQKRR